MLGRPNGSSHVIYILVCRRAKWSHAAQLIPRTL